MGDDNRVVILGAGPAGLLAALAAEQKGYDPHIIAEGEPSPIDGAQWLQRSIPGLTEGEEPTMITYSKVGSVDGYAQKAYGEPEAQVSWESFVSGDRPGWNLKKFYERLWEKFYKKIQPRHIELSDIELLARIRDVVFCSIPLKSLCRDPIAHNFEGREIMITPEPFITIPNMIVYNGRESDSWYRTSCLFDHASTEYSMENAPRVPESRMGIKPVRNDCSCLSSLPNVIKIGRFGQWRRGVLVDHAYIEAENRL